MISITITTTIKVDLSYRIRGIWTSIYLFGFTKEGKMNEEIIKMEFGS
jgi:hypothetical protein